VSRLADYLHSRIWDAIGAEADAAWAIDTTGQEIAFCCFNATLRDYARLGRLLAHDGAWEGRQLIPRQWVLDATTVKPADGHLAPGTATPYFGYGYQVWLLPGEQRRFALLGIRGQIILVDPATKLVMVHTAVRKKPSEPQLLCRAACIVVRRARQLGQ
jgi:CubicO group peptidase (beta-lactamase class C family)